MKIHIVQKGDTLWNIAQKYNVDFEKLKEMNAHLSNPDMIMPGMKIKVPAQSIPVKKEAQKKEAVHPYVDKSEKAKPMMDTQQQPKKMKEKQQQAAPQKQQAPAMQKQGDKPLSNIAPQFPIKGAPQMTQELNNYTFNIPQYPVMPQYMPSPGQLPGAVEDESPEEELPTPQLPSQVAGVTEEPDFETPAAPPTQGFPAQQMPGIPQMPYAPQAFPYPYPQHCVPTTGIMPGSGMMPYNPQAVSPYAGVPHQPWEAPQAVSPYAGTPQPWETAQGSNPYAGVPQQWGVPQAPYGGHAQAWEMPEAGSQVNGYGMPNELGYHELEESPEGYVPNMPGYPGVDATQQVPYGEAGPMMPQMHHMQGGYPHPEHPVPTSGFIPGTAYPGGYHGYNPVNAVQGHQGYMQPGGFYGYPHYQNHQPLTGGDCGCGGSVNMQQPQPGYYQGGQTNLPYGPYVTPPYPPYGFPTEAQASIRDFDDYDDESN